jgi:hypothetical protein
MSRALKAAARLLMISAPTDAERDDEAFESARLANALQAVVGAWAREQDDDHDAFALPVALATFISWALHFNAPSQDAALAILVAMTQRALTERNDEGHTVQ